MKYIKTFENSLYRVPSVIIDDIWNELWKSYKFQYPINNPNIVFEGKYNKDKDELYVNILRFNGEFMQFLEIGDKFFQGTDENKDEFKKWLYSLNLIQK